MSSSEVSLNPPRGMRDFYPDDMASREKLFQAWREAARTFGFIPYDACVVESLELLKRKAGEEIVDQIYTFKDKSGRDLALRAEMTPTLARMVAARRGSLSLPLKWHTIAQCFRYERMTRGRKREHYQWNLDIIGESCVSAEVEVIGAAVHALSGLGLDAQRVHVRFSSRALLGELLDRLGIPPAHHQATFLALDKRGKIDDAAIETQLAEHGLHPDTITRVFQLLSLDSLDDATAPLDDASPAVQQVRRFVEMAAEAGLGDILAFDISVIRGLSYYTGIVFEAFDNRREFRAIFGGGRYDNLLGDIGGAPLTGVGLGFGDVVVGELLAAQPEGRLAPAPFDLAVSFMDEAQQKVAVRLAAKLRDRGSNVDLALRPEKPKAFFSRVGNGCFLEAAYIGPDDVEQGVVRVKNLATREEREMKL